MPVPTTIADLSATAASNSPAGSDQVGTSLDDYLRAIQAIIKQESVATIDLSTKTITGTLAQFNAACSDADFAPVASPTFSGTPSAPTAPAGTDTTQVATTEFVKDQFVLGTAVASTSGSSIDFTGIPSWVKRVTMMFVGVSSNGTNNFLVQLGAGSITSAGYAGASGSIANAGASITISNTAGLGIITGGGNVVFSGTATFSLVNASTNTWVGTLVLGRSDAAANPEFGAASISLAGTLDRIRFTTNSADTFDAGSVNILWE